ncbi:MAG: hypothetical protein PUP91_18540 [Rhizonema sp. PD37]|nr:hypothetical protein [Rhizonema sp. PD37]
MRGDKFTLVVACRDRLARFGFELFQFMVEQNGGQIVVQDKTVHCPESAAYPGSTLNPSLRDASRTRLLMSNARTQKIFPKDQRRSI